MFAKKSFEKGEKVMHYQGKMILPKKDMEDQTYIFEIKHKERQYW